MKQKREEGNVAFKAERYLEANNLYTEALLIDPQNMKSNAKLHFNRATVAAKVNYLNKNMNCYQNKQINDFVLCS